MCDTPEIDDSKVKLYTEQLKNAVALCVSEDRIVWTVFGVFFASQGVLIGNFFRNGGFIQSAVSGLFLSCFGFGVSWVWWIIQKRAIGHLNRFDELVKKLEDELKVPPHLSISPSKNIEGYTRHVGNGLRVRFLMSAVCYAFIISWALAAFGYFIYCLEPLRPS